MRRDSKKPQEDMPPRAIRLSFSIDGCTIQLAQAHSVEMTLFSSENLDADAPRAPFWYEVQDEAGIPLYRAFGRNPLDPWMEVATGDPKMPLAHRKADRPENFFSLAVPELAGAHSVVLFGFAPAKPGAELDVSKPPAEIARFLFAKVRAPNTSTPSRPTLPFTGKKGA